MKLQKWEPLKGFNVLKQEIDRLFENFFTPTPFKLEKEDLFMPLDVVEKEDSFVITTELPGVNKDNIEITLDQDTLTIQGIKEEKKEEKGERYHRSERSFGTFMRSVQLPSTIDSQKVTAKFKDGILTITLKKKEEHKTKKIKINVS